MTQPKITRPVDAHRAGRFILATADDDGAQVAGIMRELAVDPASFLRFALELAAVSIGLAQRHVGTEWRSVLGNAIVDLELTEGEGEGGSTP